MSKKEILCSIFSGEMVCTYYYSLRKETPLSFNPSTFISSPIGTFTSISINTYPKRLTLALNLSQPPFSSSHGGRQHVHCSSILELATEHLGEAQEHRESSRHQDQPLVQSVQAPEEDIPDRPPPQQLVPLALVCLSLAVPELERLVHHWLLEHLPAGSQNLLGPEADLPAAGAREEGGWAGVERQSKKWFGSSPSSGAECHQSECGWRWGAEEMQLDHQDQRYELLKHDICPQRIIQPHLKSEMFETKEWEITIELSVIMWKLIINKKIYFLMDQFSSNLNLFKSIKIDESMLYWCGWLIRSLIIFSA